MISHPRLLPFTATFEAPGFHDSNTFWCVSQAEAEQQATNYSRQPYTGWPYVAFQAGKGTIKVGAAQMAAGWWAEQGMHRLEDGRLLEVEFSTKPIPHREFDWRVWLVGAAQVRPEFYSGNGSTLARALEDWVAQDQERKDMEAEE